MLLMTMLNWHLHFVLQIRLLKIIQVQRARNNNMQTSVSKSTKTFLIANRIGYHYSHNFFIQGKSEELPQMTSFLNNLMRIDLEIALPFDQENEAGHTQDGSKFGLPIFCLRHPIFRRTLLNRFSGR